MPRIDCFDIIKNNPELVAEFVSITEDMPELEQRKQAIQIVNKLLEASNESLNKVKRKVGQKPQKYNSGVSQDAIDEIIKKYSQPEQKETPQAGSTPALRDVEYYHATDGNKIIAPNEDGYKKREGANVVGEGIYFGKDKEHLTDRYGSNVIKAELDIKNPLITDNKYVVIDGREIDIQSLSKEDVKFLKEKGYDAIKYEAADKSYSNFNETIVFDKSQIKSESLLSKEQTPPALRDVESTAKALEVVDKQNFEGFKKYRTINGLLYIHEKTSDPTLDYIRVYDKSKEVGHLFYGEEKQGDGFLKGGVQVDESLQRKGIASRMYEMAEQVSGMKFVPDTPHSKSAEKLWASSSRRFGKDKSGVTIEQSISEAYHKAKKDGSNPELVKAVEDLINKNESNRNTTTEVNPKAGVSSNSNEGNSALRDVESTAKALKELDEKELDAVPNWVSKETQETETKKVTIKDGQEITLKYLYDNNIEGKVAYILGFNSNGEQISTVMIEQGKDGLWKGNDLEVDEPYRRKGLATAMYDYADEQGHNLTPTKSLQPDGVKFWGKRNKDRAKSISVAYHKAKADGSNPELVKAVESLLSKEQTPETKSETPTALRDVESTAKGEVKIKYGGKDKDLKGNPKKQWMLPKETSEQATQRLSDFVEASDYKGREQSAFIDRKGESVEVKLRNDDGKWNWYEPKSKKPFASFGTAKEAIKFIQEQPFWDNGELNKNGRNDEYFAKVKSEHIKTELENGNILEDINEGKISAEEAKSIIESAGLEIPKAVEDLLAPKTDLQEAERKLKDAWGKYLSNGISFDGMAEAEKERQLIVALLGYLKAKGIDIAKGISNEVRDFIKNKFSGVTDEMIDVAQGRMLTDYQKLYDIHMTPKNKEALDGLIAQVKSGEMSMEDFINTIDNIVPNERIKNVFISYANEQIDPLDGYVAVEEEIEEITETQKTQPSKEEERAFIGGLLARPINSKNFPNIVGGNKTDDDILKRITAVTQEDVQDRKVMVDTSYVRVALEDIKEIALQNANALYMQFGEDWQNKVMDYLSDYLNAANPAQAIGILNVISTDVQQKIEKSQSPTERTKLFKLQDKSDELSILFASQASLGINARKILRQFAQGGNMSKLVLDRILTEDTIGAIEEINKIVSSKPTNEELNSVSMPAQTPQTPKSRMQKIKENVKAALSSNKKKKPKITEQEIKELGRRAEEERKRQGVQTKMSRQQIAQMLKEEAKKC